MSKRKITLFPTFSRKEHRSEADATIIAATAAAVADRNEPHISRIVPTEDRLPIEPITEPLHQLKSADEHALSISIANQLTSVELGIRGAGTDDIISCARISRGKVELVIRGGNKKGYGLTEVKLCVGGKEECEDHVSVRFSSSPFTMAFVDDLGFCDADIFYRDMPVVLTLDFIITRALDWLSGRHVAVTERVDEVNEIERSEIDRERMAWLEKWRKAEELHYKKNYVIHTYRTQFAKCSMLVSPSTKFSSPSWLVPAFYNILHAQQEANENLDWISVCSIKEVSPGIFVFPLFTFSFCDLLLAEIASFEATTLPRRRPNTMNNFGLILNEIGMEGLMADLVKRIISPVAKKCFAREIFSSTIDCNHSFVVQYSFENGDRGLDMHHDASEVTLNVCLGEEFQGAGLHFCGQNGKADYRKTSIVLQHAKGQAVLHLGRQRHGADDITVGERTNLIVWARSSSFRAAAARGEVPLDGYPKVKEDSSSIPDKLCLSRANDDDFNFQLQRLKD